MWAEIRENVIKNAGIKDEIRSFNEKTGLCAIKNKGGNTIKIIEAYLLIYDYIDNYYKITKSCVVGDLLSWMITLDDGEWDKGPEKWGEWMYDVIEDIKKGVPVVDLGIIKEEYRTVDPATWEDWMDIAEKYIKNNTIDKEDILQITIDFLVFHKEEFDYEFDDAIGYFEKIKANR